MRAFAVLVLLALSLAGCSGGGSDDGGDAEPTASASNSSTAPPPPPLPTSDTLHFLVAPAMAPALPPGSTEAATPVTVGDFGNGGQGPDSQGAEWSYKVERHTNVSAAEVHVWVEIKETLVQSPDSPVRPYCSWTITLALGGDTGEIVGCIQEPAGPINPATKEISLTVNLESPVELEANETLTVRLERGGFSLSANNAVDALSGSEEHDSRITLRGLVEPIRKG